MKFRILLLTTILIFAVALCALAQQPARQAQRGPAPIMTKAIRELGLSRDQVQQIHAIVEKFHQDAAVVWQSNATQDEKMSQVKELRGKAGPAIMAVLNADQQAKARKMRFVDVLLAPRAVRAEVGLLALVWKLDLSANQRTTIKGIGEGATAAAKAVRDDTSLSQKDKMAKLAQIRKDTNQKVMAALTPAQQEKLKQMIANARAGK